MFGGIGCSFSNENLIILSGLVVLVLGIACAIGITQLWKLDIHVVYHQLFDSCFIHGYHKF